MWQPCLVAAPQALMQASHGALCGACSTAAHYGMQALLLPLSSNVDSTRAPQDCRGNSGRSSEVEMQRKGFGLHVSDGPVMTYY